MTSVLMQQVMSNAQILAVWNNPIVWKNFKSRMRMKALFALLLIFIISAFMTMTIYTGVDRIEGNSVQAARAAIIPLGIMQWLILMLSATKQITSGIIHERVTGTLDYTRLTPMTPMEKVIGYLFGLPIREYIGFFITMPFMIFLLVKGEIPMSAVIPVYVVFFTSAVMYHLIGTVFGLVLKEWRMSVVLTVGVVILINWVLPLFSYAGFPFLQYLTIRPVVIEKIFPYLADNSLWQEELPELTFTSQVDFFNWKISTTLFSLIVQGGLIFSLGLMVYRKWENSFNHSFSKAYAVFFFVGLQIFCIGTMWPILTMSPGSSPQFGIFETNISLEDIAFVLPLIYSFFLLTTVFWLLYIITPTRDEYRSGLLRNRKLRQMQINRFHYLDDHAGSLSSTIALAICTFVFLLYIQVTLGNSGVLVELPKSSLTEIQECWWRCRPSTSISTKYHWPRY